MFSVKATAILNPVASFPRARNTADLLPRRASTRYLITACRLRIVLLPSLRVAGRKQHNNPTTRQTPGHQGNAEKETPKQVLQAAIYRPSVAQQHGCPQKR